MTYGYDQCLGKRRRSDNVQPANIYCKLDRLRAQKLEARGPCKDRENAPVTVHRAPRQHWCCDKSRALRRGGTSQNSGAEQIYGSNLSRLRSVLPYVIEFLDTKTFVAVTHILPRVPSFYYKVRFNTKTACMVEYWMSKGYSFEWVYSNIVSERVRLEALRYAKRLPNSREIGYRLNYIPLMMT